jgi:hypothetical protein
MMPILHVEGACMFWRKPVGCAIRWKKFHRVGLGMDIVSAAIIYSKPDNSKPGICFKCYKCMPTTVASVLHPYLIPVCDNLLLKDQFSVILPSFNILLYLTYYYTYNLLLFYTLLLIFPVAKRGQPAGFQKFHKKHYILHLHFHG